MYFNRGYWNFSGIIDATTQKMERLARNLFSAMYRGVSPRHPVHMGEQASASSCAGAIACRRAGGYRGWRGWTSSQRFSLVRRAASASLGVGTPPRRRALGSETRKRDREVPWHEDGILLRDSSVEYSFCKLAKIARANASSKETHIWKQENSPIHFEEDRDVAPRSAINWLLSGTSISCENDISYRGSSN